MIKKDFNNMLLPALGVGMMRLPTEGEGEVPIDEKETEKMIAYAMEHGVNYFDTAWGYHKEESEWMAGRLLSKYPRESYFLADKFPGYDLENMDKAEEIFEKQLEKCQTDYFDFYMFHNVCELNIDAYLDEKYGILQYLLKQKARGRIRHLGFSVHGAYPVLQRFLQQYGAHMEFCQIQLNYLDWKFQDAKAKTELLKKYEIPVWVMEPLRGGYLANLSAEDEAALNKIRPKETAVETAFRFIQALPQVKVTLSGMSDFEQLKENIRIFEEEKPLTSKEMEQLLHLADDMISKIGVPCTGCSYCVNHCPQGLDIPKLLQMYNEHQSTKNGISFIAPMFLSTLPQEKRPAACIGCGSCEAVCPQQLKIAETLKDFAASL